MVNRLWCLDRGIDPRFNNLNDKEAVFANQSGIHYAAFEVSVTLFDKRRVDKRADFWGKFERCKLVDLGTRTIAACDNLLS